MGNLVAARAADVPVEIEGPAGVAGAGLLFSKVKPWPPIGPAGVDIAIGGVSRFIEVAAQHLEGDAFDLDLPRSPDAKPAQQAERWPPSLGGMLQQEARNEAGKASQCRPRASS